MNSRKRPALEPISSLRSGKQPRTALLNGDGERQSPTLNDIYPRWKRIFTEVASLGRDTFAVFFTRLASRPDHTQQRPSSPIDLTHSPVRLSPERAPSPSFSPRSTDIHSSTSYPIPSVSFTFSPPRISSTSEEPHRRSLYLPSSSPTPFNSPSSSNLHSSQKPRTKGLMGPPELPPSCSSTIPPSSEASTSRQSTPRNAVELALKSRMSEDGIKRNYQNRQHIHHNKHKQDVRAKREKDREEMKKELYRIRKSEGFRSNFDDFKSLLDFRVQLETSIPKHLGLLSPSASLTDLRSRYDALETRPRRYSDVGDWLQKQLELARQTLSQNKPPSPFSPSLEQLRIRNRARDDDIEQRLRPKRIPLPSSLPAQDEAQVNVILKRRGVISRYAREQVSDSDLTRLKPSCWLNDEIINFYGAMILGRSDDSKENKENPVVNGVSGSKKKKPLNVHYFSTFFWSKLEKEGYDKGRLAKWTKRLDLFSKDVILIPVNHNNMHWTAAAINFRQKRIESYDSMNMDRSIVFKRLRNYLDAEHRNKKKAPFDFTDWEDHTLEDTPQQENGYDCGVFTCQFLESLSRGEETFNFTQSDIPYLRRRMIWEIGNAKLRDDP